MPEVPVENTQETEVIPQIIPGAEVATTITAPTNTETTTLPETNITVPKKRKGKKILTFFIFIVLWGASAYVLKTMYPLEYESLKVNVLSIMGQTPATTEEGLEELLEATWDVQTDVIDPTEDTEALTGTTEEETTEGTGTTEMTGDAFDAFEELDEIVTDMDPDPVQSDTTLKQLKEYNAEANTFLELSTKIDDKTMKKYATYIIVKSNQIILDIETNKEIDTKKVESYLAQFAGYLTQLRNLTYGESEPTETTTEIWTGEDTETSNDMIEDINRDTETEEIPAV